MFDIVMLLVGFCDVGASLADILLKFNTIRNRKPYVFSDKHLPVGPG